MSMGKIAYEAALEIISKTEPWDSLRDDLKKVWERAASAVLAQDKRESEKLRERLADWELFRSQFSILGYHYQAIGCGIEDRQITDRYGACQYGWDEAMDRVAELMPEEVNE